MLIFSEVSEKECFKVRKSEVCRTSYENVQDCAAISATDELLLCVMAFAGDCPLKAYSTEFFRVVIYVVCVCASLCL